VDCSRVEELKTALDGFCSFAISEKEALASHLKASSSAAQRFTYRDYADLGDFITRVSQAGGETLQLKCSQVKAAYIKCVVSNKTQGEALNNSTGISVYLPLTHIKQAYATLQFAKLSLWDEMLREALGVKEGW